MMLYKEYFENSIWEGLDQERVDAFIKYIVVCN